MATGSKQTRAAFVESAAPPCAPHTHHHQQQQEPLRAAPMSDSLSSLRVYDSSSSSASSEVDDDDDDLMEDTSRPPPPPRGSHGDDPSGVIITDVLDYRRRSTSTCSSSSSGTSSSSSDDSSVEELGGDGDDGCEGAVAGTIKMKSGKSISADRDRDLCLDGLPPPVDISSLTLDVKEEDCLHMGNVISIVDRLVMVQALPDMPAYDLDTLLFLDKGKRALGHVFDVIGQVTSPMYAIRFNSKEEIQSKGIRKEQAVYSVPNSTDHTQYVFLKQLMKMKGSDASWKNDTEVPIEYVDFSDDDIEYTFSKQHFNEIDTSDNRQKRNSLEKHRMFETAMNLKNKVDTARRRVHDKRDVAPPPKRFAPQAHAPQHAHAHPSRPPQPPQHQQPPVQQNLYFPPPPAQCSPFAPPPFLAPPPQAVQFVRMPTCPPLFGMPPPPFPAPYGAPVPSFAHHPPSFAAFGPPPPPPGVATMPPPPQSMPNFSGAAPPPPPPPYKSYPPPALAKQHMRFAPAAPPPTGPPPFAIPMQQWAYGGVACTALPRPFPPQKGVMRKPFAKR